MIICALNATECSFLEHSALTGIFLPLLEFSTVDDRIYYLPFNHPLLNTLYFFK